MRHRKQTVIIGAERSGKTFFANKLCKIFNANGKRAIVYNQGLEGDYLAEPAKVLDYEDTYRYVFRSSGKKAAKEYKALPSLEYVEYENSIYNIGGMQYFLPPFVSIDPIMPPAEDYFFKAIFDYSADGLLVLDDCKHIVKSGLGKWLGNLTRRKNHTGKMIPGGYRGRGMDLVFMFHDVDDVNPAVWKYTTNVVLFPTVDTPSFRNLTNPTMRGAFSKMWGKLDKAKQRKDYFYDAFELNLKGGYNIQKISGKQVQKI